MAFLGFGLAKQILDGLASELAVIKVTIEQVEEGFLLHNGSKTGGACYSQLSFPDLCVQNEILLQHARQARDEEIIIAYCHELGHATAALRRKRAQWFLLKAAFEMPLLGKEIILDDEKRAWDIGQKYAEMVGIPFELYEKEKRRCLETYEAI